MVSRPARIFFAALATALLIYYHSTLLAVSGIGWESNGESTTVIQLPIPIPHGDSKDKTLTPPDSSALDGGKSSTGAGSGSSDSGTGSSSSSSSSKTELDFDHIETSIGNDKGDKDESAFNEVKFEFQNDLVNYRQPKIDVTALKKYAPHNDHGKGQFAFATYLSTRNNSVQDPYFLSAQQLVYRLLWDPKSRSALHPVVVFVAPFIPQEQRDILAAQGAIVRELPLVPWDPPPSEDGSIFPFARWKDLFSKLNIWGQLDFARIAFLDLDAFPVKNADAIFDQSNSPRQKCKAELLPPEDKLHEKEICDYVWSGQGLWDGVNVGVVVLEPNKYMHERLLRESQDTSKFDNKMAEQAFLNYAFRLDGPFPPFMFGREWNGYYPQADEEDKLNIVHEKLWIFGDLVPWTKNIFKDGWDDILKLYESPQFAIMRSQDGLAQ